MLAGTVYATQVPNQEVDSGRHLVEFFSVRDLDDFPE